MRSPLLLLPLLGCSYSLDGQIAQTRAEIVRLERSIPPESPLWVHDGPDNFDQFIEDDTPRVPDFIYHHLLRKLKGMSVSEVEALSSGRFDWDACLKDPATFRGRIFRTHGVIGRLESLPVAEATCPVKTVHEGILFDARRRPVRVHIVEKPDVVILREDTVETVAVFVKLIEYTSVAGQRVTAPFFVGKVLRRYL